MNSCNGFINDFVISSSWILECEDIDLRSTVTLNSSNKRVCLEDIVQLDTCVHFIRNGEIKDNWEPCTVRIMIPEPSPQLILQLAIVSEARIIELFGSCGEYLSTCTAEYVDDFEDCAVYLAECTVKPSREILIKFQKSKHAHSLWLYGINVRLCQSKCALPAFSSINFQSVNEILKEAKIPISENAEKCKTFLQAYGGAFSHIQPPFKGKTPNPQILMKMLEAGYFNSFGDAGKNMSKCFSNFVPFLTKDGIGNKSTSESDVGQNNGGHSSDVLILKNCIDQRFTELENRIERFEQKIVDLEKKQNEKLDCILALLNKSNN